jgi:glutathione-independent formaldehyde dehydrogenase
MKAVVFADRHSIAVEDVPDAVIEEPEDVVVRVSSSAICGTDLHMYDGRTGQRPDSSLGTSRWASSRRRVRRSILSGPETAW